MYCIYIQMLIKANKTTKYQKHEMAWKCQFENLTIPNYSENPL